MLPFFLLGMAELVLRACKIGYNTQLFIPAADERFYVMNPNVSAKYFTIGENATIGNQDIFFRKKPLGTLRFFVLGASSSLGFPYMYNGCFARMLKYRLQFTYPHTNIEIINLSLTAINSYTLYDFSRQLIDYEPDGVLVYAGQNEFYGALGVASSSKFARNVYVTRLMMAAKEFRLVQLLNIIVKKLHGTRDELINKDHTLMERMADRKLVPYNSQLYEDGIVQFRTNMEDMISLFCQHRVPVFIGTLVSNLKDQEPFAHSDSDSLNAWKEYTLGDSWLVKKNYKKAREHFEMAKEYDKLRFRAPSVFNGIIQWLAHKYPNVYVVDVEKAFKKKSVGGIIGNELLLEHVHPNLAGHRIMADNYFEIIKDNYLDKQSVGEKVFDLKKEDYPYTAFDTICGDISIRQLRQQWPFNETPQVIKTDTNTIEYKMAQKYKRREINWGQAMQRLNNKYIQREDYKNALRVIEQMCLDVPYEIMFVSQAARLSGLLDLQEKARFYSNKEIELMQLLDTPTYNGK